MKRLVALTIGMILLICASAQAGVSQTKSFKIKVTLPDISRSQAPLSTSNTAIQNTETVKANGQTVIIEKTVRQDGPVILKSFVVR